MTAHEAWLLGGPVDGRMMFIDATAAGELPEELRLPQAGMFYGSRDVPDAVVEHVYFPVVAQDGQPPTYRYDHCDEARPS